MKNSIYSPYSEYNTPWVSILAPEEAFVFDRFPGRAFTARKLFDDHFTQNNSRYTPARLAKFNTRYEVKERSGRGVNVGSIVLFQKYIVNPQADGSFQALFLFADYDGIDEPRWIVISYQDYLRRRFHPHLHGFPRSPDCPAKYIDLAVENELITGAEIKFLALPARSGWSKGCNGCAVFASSAIVIPELKNYYAKDVLERRLVSTTLTVTEAAEELAKILPQAWQFKLLLAIRLTALLLFFYEEAGLLPDQMLVVEPTCEYHARGVTAMLKTQSCEDISTTSLLSSKTDLRCTLDLVNDGIALFRDCSFIEDNRKRDESLGYLSQELIEANGMSDQRRKLIAILTNHAGNISSELPALFLNMHGCPDIDDISGFQAALGAFDTAFLSHIACSDRRENEITQSLRTTAHVSKTIAGSDPYKMVRMLRTSVHLLRGYRLISPAEEHEIIQHLKRDLHEAEAPDLLVLNEFAAVLSDQILHSKIRLANQFAPPYYDLEKPMAVVDEHYINLSADTLNIPILFLMRSTQRRNKVLHAAKTLGKLHATNNYKRAIDVSTSASTLETFSFYSFPKSILSPKCSEFVDALAYSEFLFREQQFPDGLIPLITVGDGKVAGRVVDDATDELESIFCCGKSRSGKSFFTVQQALIRAERGDTVIVFDQSGTWSRKQLRENFKLSEAAIGERFVFWELNKQGLPIDLLSFEQCDTKPAKKQHLYSILATAGKITGDIQGKILRKQLPGIIQAIESNEIRTLSDLPNWLDVENPRLSELRDRLEAVFDDLGGQEMPPRNWGEFLGSSGKIVVITSGTDGAYKRSELFDVLLASLYEYKQNDPRPRYTVILDEIADLCLDKGSPIDILLRKGAKHRITMLLSTQEFSADEDKRLAKLIANCGMLAIFRPLDNDLGGIAKHTSVDRSTLAGLNQGESSSAAFTAAPRHATAMPS